MSQDIIRINHDELKQKIWLLRKSST